MSIVVTTIISTAARDAIKQAVADGNTPTVIADKARAQAGGSQYRGFAYKAKTYIATDTIVDDVAAMNALIAAYPEAEIIGAWDFDTGDIVIAPTHPNHIDLMPDDVTYDVDGNELTRARPTQVRDVHLYYGQAQRKFA